MAESEFITRQPLRGARRIYARAMRERVQELLEPLGVPLDPDRLARDLSSDNQ